jgi:hypothetical protein
MSNSFYIGLMRLQKLIDQIYINQTCKVINRMGLSLHRITPWGIAYAD